MNIDALIQNMTLHEKAAMLQGWSNWTTFSLPRLDIPEIFLADGPHGLRKETGAAKKPGLQPSHPATCFPTASSFKMKIACSKIFGSGDCTTITCREMPFTIKTASLWEILPTRRRFHSSFTKGKLQFSVPFEGLR